MPLYEYGCRGCGKTFEIVQKFSDPVLTDCPECGKPALEKMISQTSFALKGGGWFASGYSKTPGASTESAPKGTPVTPATPKKEGGS